MGDAVGSHGRAIGAAAMRTFAGLGSGLGSNAGETMKSLRGWRDFESKVRSRRPDSNRGPAVYETAALPLSYAGTAPTGPAARVR